MKICSKAFSVFCFVTLEKWSKSKKLICKLRASVADVVKIMSFYHTKSLLYYFTTSIYNISFLRCSIFLPLHLNIISLFFLTLILFFLYYLFNGNILFFLSNFNVPYNCWEWKRNKKLISPIYHILSYSCIFVIIL